MRRKGENREEEREEKGRWITRRMGTRRKENEGIGRKGLNGRKKE